MRAPERFAQWLRNNLHTDRYGNTYNYHPRSDAHSIALCQFILEDLLQICPILDAQMRRGEIAYNINFSHVWPMSQQPKTLDLAIGKPAPEHLQQSLLPGILKANLLDVLLSCEAKAAMTEHGKSKPRLFDELSSSHEIVHRGRPEAIAAGICAVNIAHTFVSPLRNKAPGITDITPHRQPHAADDMIQHLRRLSIANAVGQSGFDAYCTFVVDCDNQGHVALHTNPPAPQPNERDHYETFLQRLSQLYTERFSVIP